MLAACHSKSNDKCETITSELQFVMHFVMKNATLNIPLKLDKKKQICCEKIHRLIPSWGLQMIIVCIRLNSSIHDKLINANYHNEPRHSLLNTNSSEIVVSILH